MVEFQSEAAKRDWKIMSVQHFDVTTDATEVDVQSNLELIKTIGAACQTEIVRMCTFSTFPPFVSVSK